MTEPLAVQLSAFDPDALAAVQGRIALLNDTAHLAP